MKKINILKKNYEFNRIINENKPFKYKNYIVYLEKKNQDFYTFGISVGKKIGKAVVRNKVKRRIKDIIDDFDYQNGFNCIIIVRKNIIFDSYDDMKKDLNYIFRTLFLLKEN